MHQTKNATSQTVDENVSSIRRIIETSFEPSEPQNKILEFFKQNEGKRIDVRAIEKMKEFVGRDDLCLSKKYGMSHIEWKGGNMLLAHREKNLTFDPDSLNYFNSSYFSAKDERNAKRNENLGQIEKIEELAETIKVYNTARIKLYTLLREFEDKYSIQKAMVEGENG